MSPYSSSVENKERYRSIEIDAEMEIGIYEKLIYMYSTAPRGADIN